MGGQNAALISPKFPRGECECNVRSEKEFSEFPERSSIKKNKVRIVSETTLYTAPLDAYFFVSTRVIRGESVLENKNETRHRSRANSSILTSGGNRIVDAEKLERYFTLPILFFSPSSDSEIPEDARVISRRRKPVFVSRPFKLRKKMYKLVKYIFPR